MAADVSITCAEAAFRVKTFLKRDQEQFIRSHAPTALYNGETTRRNELKRATNIKKGDFNNNIAEHVPPKKQATLSTGTLLRALPTAPTTINELHSKAGLPA